MNQPSNALRRLSVASLCGGLVSLALVSSGCRQQAITELYVENLTSEIRSLEDIVYECDAEFNAMENELKDLRRINQELESRLRDAKQPAREQLSTRPGSDFPGVAEPILRGPPPLRLDSENNSSLMELEVPEVIVPTKPNGASPSPTNAAPTSPPLGTQPTLQTPSIPPASIPPAEVLPGQPTSLPGQPSGVKEPLRRKAPAGLPSDVSDASIEQRRIASPVQLASAVEKRTVAATPKDPHVREIEFHPTLCRGHNLDGTPGDDGLYLVLVPRNGAKQFVPANGSLTIVIEEPVSETEARRIGRWEFTPAELAEMREPIGSDQGAHLQLTWNEVVPEGSTIVVYARFVGEDGTTMVNRKEIHLRKPGPGQATWTPR